LIGANLVSSGEITKLGGTVRGLVSVAGPIGVRNLPPEVKVLSIEAKNDLVPKLDLADVPTTSNHIKLEVTNKGPAAHDLKAYRASISKLNTSQYSALNQKFSSLFDSGSARLTAYAPERITA
jgi:hypothetical protein